MGNLKIKFLFETRSRSRFYDLHTIFVGKIEIHYLYFSNKFKNEPIEFRTIATNPKKYIFFQQDYLKKLFINYYELKGSLCELPTAAVFSR